uniref:Transmembrane protein n=1 Tax=Setaria italica TaxID=4555 RepID=K3ZYL5_SETIT
MDDDGVGVVSSLEASSCRTSSLYLCWLLVVRQSVTCKCSWRLSPLQATVILGRVLCGGGEVVFFLVVVFVLFVVGRGSYNSAL